MGKMPERWRVTLLFLQSELSFLRTSAKVQFRLFAFFVEAEAPSRELSGMIG
jgi:hypothetical protein